MSCSTWRLIAATPVTAHAHARHPHALKLDQLSNFSAGLERCICIMESGRQAQVVRSSMARPRRRAYFVCAAAPPTLTGSAQRSASILGVQALPLPPRLQPPASNVHLECPGSRVPRSQFPNCERPDPRRRQCSATVLPRYGATVRRPTPQPEPPHPSCWSLPAWVTLPISAHLCHRHRYCTADSQTQTLIYLF